MNIVWLTSEMAPYAKTGGLADVSASLPGALAKRGHNVSVIMPYYSRKVKGLASRFKVHDEPLGVPFGHGENWARIIEDKISENLSVYFIEHDFYFDRDGLYDWLGYGYHDNAERFMFFSRACMQAILALKLAPDIVHTNDWHTALANVYLRSPIYRRLDNFRETRSVLTIHNIGYQGICDKMLMDMTGLGWAFFNYFCLEYYDQINLLKGGIMTADMVNTVSPTYAAEILSPEFGFTMESALQHQAAMGRMRGIINGIDVDVWGPENDDLLPAKFNADDLSGKKRCRKELQKIFNLPERKNTPIIAMITRLAGQKGVDVFIDAAKTMMLEDDVRFVVVGTGEQEIERELNALAAAYPDKFAVYIGYASDKLAHLVEAGADMFLMPSRYEPCGLNQMYSMRYGTVPIVRATGGLDDTVTNFEVYHWDHATGFKFWDLTSEAVLGTVRWAADVWRKQPNDFKRLQINGMRKDFSWNHTAELYERLYDDARRGF